MTRESPEARAERILAELRAATAEAAGVAKDLTAASKQARLQVDGYLHDEVERACNAYLGQAQEGIERFIKDAKDDVERQISALADHAAAEIAEIDLDWRTVKLISALALYMRAHAGQMTESTTISEMLDQQGNPRL